jgi:predicted metal-binding protein
MRKVFDQYQWAVVFKRDVDPTEIYAPSSEAQAQDTDSDDRKRRQSFHRQTWEILGHLESHVQSEGYDLAMGFSAGSCKSSLCGGAPCSLLENGACRFILRARPAMEAVGIDVFDLASKVGWDAYMMRVTEPDVSVIPSAMSVGIVFVY